MKVAFLGTGEFGVPTLRALRDGGHEIVAAVSQPDRPAGRGRKVRPTPVRAATVELDLPHVQAEDVNALDFHKTLDGAELGVVVAFGQKLGNELLAFFPRGCINLHGSLLPRHRGAAPFQWSILSGDAEAGITVFQINERWDAGDVYATRSTPIGATETAAELHDRLALIGAELVVEVVDGLAAGAARPHRQVAAHATRARKLSKADSEVDWSQPAAAVVRWINGLWSWPAAAAKFVDCNGRQERVQLARAELIDTTSRPDHAQPGAFLSDGSIQAGEGRLRILQIKPAGRKLMDFEAFAAARDIDPPAHFAPLREGST